MLEYRRSRNSWEKPENRGAERAYARSAPLFSVLSLSKDRVSFQLSWSIEYELRSNSQVMEL